MIDKASYLKMIDEKEFNFKENFPVELQEDYDVIVALLKKDNPPFDWKDLSEKAKQNPKIVGYFLENNHVQYRMLSEEMKNSPEIIDQLMEIGISEEDFKVFPEKYRSDEAFVKKALAENGKIFQWIAEPLKAKKELVLLAIEMIIGQAQILYQHMSEDLKKDKELIKLLLKQDVNVFDCLSDEFKNDFDLIEVILPESPYESARIYEKLSPQYQQSYDLALRIVQGFDFPLALAPLEWRKNPDFVCLAVVSATRNYEYIDETLKSDFSFIEKLYGFNYKIEQYLDEATLDRLRPRVLSPIHYAQQVEVIREKDIASMTTFAKSVKVFKNEKLILQFDQMPIAEYEEDGPCGSYTALRAIQYLLLVGEFIFFVRQNTGVQTNQMHTEGKYLFAPSPQTDTKFLNHQVFLIDPTKCKNFKDLKSLSYELYFDSFDKYLPKGITCYQSPQEYHDVWNILYNPLKNRNYDYELINSHSLQVNKKSYTNEIYGAAYVYIGGFGWRFLIPNTLGSHEALEKLIYSTLLEDWQWIQSQAKPLTRSQVDLLYRAFKTEAFFADVEKYSKQYHQD